MATSERRLREGARQTSEDRSIDTAGLAPARAEKPAGEARPEAVGPLLGTFVSAMLESVSDALLAVDARGRTVLVNDAGRRLFGESDAAPGARERGEPSFYLADGQTPCHADDLPLERALRGERVPRAEFVLRGPAPLDGGRYSVTARPVVDAEGIVRGAVLVARASVERLPARPDGAERHARQTRLLDEAIEAATQAGERLMADMESGTHPIARGPSVGEVEYACNEVDIALAEIAVCIDFLAQAQRSEPEKAASDAHLALRRVCAVVDRLRSSCQRARASQGDRAQAEPVAWAGARRRF